MDVFRNQLKIAFMIVIQKRFLLSLVLISALLLPAQSIAGNPAIGQWRHHLPNKNIIDIAETPSQIIGATSFGLVVFNKADNSLDKINKVDGLTDFGITNIAWAHEQEYLLIGYDNGNIDVMSGNNFLNISDIAQASIIGSKKINDIHVEGDRALLGCDFGIVELDLSNLFIRDTWFIGPHGSMVNVNDVSVYNENIYAATNAGLLHAPTDAPNLADYQYWQAMDVTGGNDEVFNLLEWHNGQLLVNQHGHETDQLYVYNGDTWQPFTPPEVFDGERIHGLYAGNGKLLVASGNRLDIFDESLEPVTYVEDYYGGRPRPNTAMYDQDNTLWIADRNYGLVKQHEPQFYEKMVLPGPPYANAFGLAAANGRLWVAPGVAGYGGPNFWNDNGYYFLQDGQWEHYNRWGAPLLEDMIDLIRITVDPGNPDKAYAASWFGGMAVITPDGPEQVYNETNSTLQRRAGIGDRLRIGDVAVDRDGNVWVTNSEVDTPLSVMKPDGEWMAFSSGGTFDPQTLVRDIIIDNHGQKWVILPHNGIFVFRENTLQHTNDFEARRLTTQSGSGNLPSNSVHSMAVDHNGNVWVGTQEGVAVFYSPQQAFSGQPFDAQRIIVQQEDGFAGYLLETETVTSITVDGSNKKWFATSRSGAFLLSSDGRETIFHFHKENSPLPSNNILDIAINDQNGEVFFATDRGLVSFRGFATEATAQHRDVYAYPNPVEPGYDGYIAVKGLVRNANVKITDINGHLVWETVAEGGQAVWNGQDIHGRRPSSGVYLVFSTNEDGEETMVTKIMFIN